MKHLISLNQFSAQAINRLLALASNMKKKPAAYKNSLKGKAVGLLFEKASLRTKTAFYIGAIQLGAHAVYYMPEEVKLGKREKVADVARTLSRYLDLIVLRTFSHQSIQEFAAASAIPVVNGLSDLFHPTQVLADILTIKESRGELKKLKVVYIGDGNNVCNSLIYAFAMLGGNLTVASPAGYSVASQILKEAGKLASRSKAVIKSVNSVSDAATGADVLYTDVWVSMGSEKEAGPRKKAFKNFRIDGKILKLAKKDAIVMHCLPAHRGEEISDAVIDSKNSVVFEQAENRLHTAKAVLYYLLKP